MRRIVIVAVGLMVLGRAAAASPEREASQHFNAGQRAFEDGDFARAADELKAAIALKPTVKALLTLGNTYIKLGQLDDARAALARIVEIDPKSSKRKQVEALIHNLDTLAKTRLVVVTQPPGATVYLDMKADGARGKTPATVPVLPGRHRVMIELDGYEPQVLPDVLAVEGQDVPVAATLRLRGCDATLETTPPSRASIDDAPAVPTPVVARLVPGEHVVRFSAQGYVEKRRPLTCEVDKPLVLREALEPVPFATLTVHAPPLARVDIDDKPTREPAQVRLAPGAHHLSVDGGALGRWDTTLTLANGQELELTPTLVAPPKPPAPRMIVTVDPPDATVRVDGDVVAPDVPLTMTPGRHSLLVLGVGRNAYGEHIELAPGETVHFSPRLQRRGAAAAYAGMAFTFLALGAGGVLTAIHFSGAPDTSSTWNTAQWTMVGLTSGFGFVAFIAYSSAVYLRFTTGLPSDGSLWRR